MFGKYIRKEKFITKKWSGGTTTEIYISPEDGDFATGNFDFRLSTATVEKESSTFTRLKGVSRTLMVLDGRMHLTHEGQHQSDLKKFDVDEFEGDWKTTSKGKCVDLNLMTKGTIQGGLEAFKIKKGVKFKYVNEDRREVIFYVAKGGGEAFIDNEIYYMDQGDALYLQKDLAFLMFFTASKATELIIADILR